MESDFQRMFCSSIRQLGAQPAFPKDEAGQRWECPRPPSVGQVVRSSAITTRISLCPCTPLLVARISFVDIVDHLIDCDISGFLSFAAKATKKHSDNGQNYRKKCV